MPETGLDNSVGKENVYQLSVTFGYTTTSTNTASVAFVGNTVDYPFKTIQSAIDNSPPNTVLHIARGVYDPYSTDVCMEVAILFKLRHIFEEKFEM